MNCTECRFALENDCPGCMRGKVFEDEECEVLECCVGKGFEHCGKCESFPCDMLKEISFDKLTGDGGARLMRLKALRDDEYRRKRSMMYALIGGGGAGISLGAVAGGISGAFAPWIFAGAVIGCGVGFIIRLSKNKK